jgi:hypothetical protein
VCRNVEETIMRCIRSTLPCMALVLAAGAVLAQATPPPPAPPPPSLNGEPPALRLFDSPNVPRQSAPETRVELPTTIYDCERLARQAAELPGSCREQVRR